MKKFTSNGIMFTWDISSSKGASFILFPDKSNTPEQINKAKQEIRNNQDDVSLSIADENDRDYLYKTEIFQVPETKHLKWYQIEQDERLIRKERLKGTPPQEFVSNFVLPFTYETEKRFIEKHGAKIYQL